MARTEDEIWKQVAFITRYGGQDLDYVLQMDRIDSWKYMNALAELISEENKPSAKG